MRGIGCLEKIMASNIRSENDGTDVAQIEAKIKSETMVQYILPRSIVLYRFCFAAQDCVRMVKRFPIKPDANMSDFIQLGALNMRRIITKARLSVRESIKPEQKHRQLSKKNVFLATSVFEKTLNMAT
jgi:hypothetical protein